MKDIKMLRTIDISKAEFKKIVKDNALTTVSSKIRWLDENTKSDRSMIARYLEKRYQHVRNVLTQPLTTKEVKK